MIKITLPDKSVREYPKGTTSLEIAQSISEGLARNVLAANVNGQVLDATRPIQHDAELRGTLLHTFWQKHWRHCTQELN
jgi:threonyl-tRNA synthetase